MADAGSVDLRALVRPAVDSAELRACTQVSRWRSLALCLALYVGVVASMWVGGPASHWWLALPALVVIAGLQMHLLILLHEGAHLLLHPSRRINDGIADVFCAVPFFTLEKFYRVFHLTHHKYAGSPERDPEARLYGMQGYHYARKPPVEFAWALVRDLCGVAALRYLRDMSAWLAEQHDAGRVAGFTRRDAALYLAVWGPIVIASWRWALWPQLLLFWVLPQITVMFFFLKLHGYGEHTGATGPTEFERTWTHAIGPFESFFIAPIYSQMHLEHHLFPRVPWYHMARFERALRSTPGYREAAIGVTVSSYLVGANSIVARQLLGHGEYRILGLQSRISEIRGEVLGAQTKHEIDDQLAALPPQAAVDLEVAGNG